MKSSEKEILDKMRDPRGKVERNANRGKEGFPTSRINFRGNLLSWEEGSKLIGSRLGFIRRLEGARWLCASETMCR